MSGRNRAEGWQHAKLSGHENEALLEAIVERNSELQSRLLMCGKQPTAEIERVDFGGLKEHDVDCILGGKTKSKSDIHIYLTNGTQINVSIKKSEGGQVYLIGVDRFIEGFERQFNKFIPSDVKRAISLFWGTAEDTLDIVGQYSQKNKAYETRKHRLVQETLYRYDSHLCDCLLQWFNDNIKELFLFCFATGMASEKSEWANIVWYRNELNENDMDEMFFIEDVVEKLQPIAEYGNRTGGSTIQLPFGFVQWHSPTKVIPGCMQFHHSYEKLKELMK